MGQVCYGVPEMVKIPSTAYSTPLHLTLIEAHRSTALLCAYIIMK